MKSFSSLSLSDGSKCEVFECTFLHYLRAKNRMTLFVDSDIKDI